MLRLNRSVDCSIELMKAHMRGDTAYPFTGQDAMMWIDVLSRSRNLCSVYVSISEENPTRGEALYQDVRDRVKRYIEKGGSKGLCRARWYEPCDLLYTYTDESVDVIADELVIRGTDRLDATELSHLITKFPLRWVVYENSYHAIVSHQFADGCRFSELSSVPLDNYIIDWEMIPEFTYIPGITELVGVVPKIVPTLNVLANMSRNLSLDLHWKTHDSRAYTQPQITLSKIKQIKRHIAENYGKLPYSMVLTCISIWNVFLCTTKKQMTVGVSGAFRDTRSIHRFNNFSAATLVVRRPDGFDAADAVTQFYSVVKQIVKFAPDLKSQLIATYLATNVYNLDYNAVNPLDVLVSCSPSNLPAKYNGFSCKVQDAVIIGSAAPIYYGWWNSDDKTVASSILVRSNDVDASKARDANALIS